MAENKVPTAGILSLLGKAGKDTWDFVARRYLPAAIQTTRTDEGLKYFKGQQKLQQESLEQLHKQLAERGKRLSREAQDIIDSISGPKSASGSIAKPGATQREIKKITQQVNELQKEKNILDDIIARGVEGLNNREIMAYEYQREKVGGLLKGLLAAVGATAGGILLGGKAAGGQQYQQYTDPDEAIEALEKEVQIGPTFGQKLKSGDWGPDVANVLMDVISPIPRQ